MCGTTFQQTYSNWNHRFYPVYCCRECYLLAPRAKRLRLPRQVSTAWVKPATAKPVIGEKTLPDRRPVKERAAAGILTITEALPASAKLTSSKTPEEPFGGGWPLAYNYSRQVICLVCNKFCGSIKKAKMHLYSKHDFRLKDHAGSV